MMCRGGGWSLYVNRCVSASAASEDLEAPGANIPFSLDPVDLEGGRKLAPSSPFSSKTWCLAAEGVAEAERKTGLNTVAEVAAAAAPDPQKNEKLTLLRGKRVCGYDTMRTIWPPFLFRMGITHPCTILAGAVCAGCACWE